MGRFPGSRSQPRVRHAAISDELTMRAGWSRATLGHAKARRHRGGRACDRLPRLPLRAHGLQLRLRFDGQRVQQHGGGDQGFGQRHVAYFTYICTDYEYRRSTSCVMKPSARRRPGGGARRQLRHHRAPPRRRDAAFRPSLWDALPAASARQRELQAVVVRAARCRPGHAALQGAPGRTAAAPCLALGHGIVVAAAVLADVTTREHGRWHCRPSARGLRRRSTTSSRHHTRGPKCTGLLRAPHTSRRPEDSRKLRRNRRLRISAYEIRRSALRTGSSTLANVAARGCVGNASVQAEESGLPHAQTTASACRPPPSTVPCELSVVRPRWSGQTCARRHNFRAFHF